MLLARTYELIRCDIPKNRVEVDYQLLEEVATSDSGLAKLYGITSISDPKQINAAYPYSLTDIANELGYKNWYNANLLLEKIRSEKNEDIKASDNRYHIAIKAGERVTTRKYSKKLVELLKRVRDGEDYYIKLDMPIKENE